VNWPGRVAEGRTLVGVTRLANGRGGGSAAFDLALNADGLEIRHSGEDVRHVPWSQISEWEMARRRGGVRLLLRGGGAVTAVAVPGWSVDDLSALFTEMTTPVAGSAA
jgi:hypothetical protein